MKQLIIVRESCEFFPVGHVGPFDSIEDAGRWLEKVGFEKSPEPVQNQWVQPENKEFSIHHSDGSIYKPKNRIFATVESFHQPDQCLIFKA